MVCRVLSGRKVRQPQDAILAVLLPDSYISLAAELSVIPDILSIHNILGEE